MELSAGPLGAVQRADRELARQTALRARALADFAASRPATADRAQGEPGAMSAERWASQPECLRQVSEWATQELVIALSITSQAAESLLTRSLNLVHLLPGTLAALEAGALHPGHLWPMLDKVAPIQDAKVRREVETALLRWAAGRVTTPAQLGAKARREVARRNARDAARRLDKALKERGVYLQAADTDGMAIVSMLATVPEAEALYRTLSGCVDAIDADADAEDERTRGQKMVDCLLDLVLRPGTTDIPPVQVLLTVVATLGTLVGGDEPGEIDGHVVPPMMIRELLHALAGHRQDSSLTVAPDRQAAEPPREPTAPASGRVDTDEPVPDHAPDPASGQMDTTEPVPDAATVADPAPGGVLATEPDSRSAPVPWQQAEQEELERWWCEMERRVLADEVGLGPEPLPPDQTSVPPDLPPDPLWPSGPDLTPDPDLTRDPDLPPDPDIDRSDAPSDGPGASSPENRRWWASADQAVDAAGRALRRADEAMAHARRMVHTAYVADAADEATWQAGPSGRFTRAENALDVLRACTGAQRDHLAELLATTGGGGLADRPRVALVDALSGALLALTDLPEMRRTGTCDRPACRRAPENCRHALTDRPGLGPPGPTDGYRPSAPLDRWVRARDRRCRQPGCRRRVPRGGELDHHRPYPLGPTSAGNLAGYCTTHHRGKHQAPGWRHDLAPDGTLTVTTPTGLTAVTTPPAY